MQFVLVCAFLKMSFVGFIVLEHLLIVKDSESKENKLTETTSSVIEAKCLNLFVAACSRQTNNGTNYHEFMKLEIPALLE